MHKSCYYTSHFEPSCRAIQKNEGKSGNRFRFLDLPFRDSDTELKNIDILIHPEPEYAEPKFSVNSFLVALQYKKEIDASQKLIGE